MAEYGNLLTLYSDDQANLDLAASTLTQSGCRHVLMGSTFFFQTASAEQERDILSVLQHLTVPFTFTHIYVSTGAWVQGKDIPPEKLEEMQQIINKKKKY